MKFFLVLFTSLYFLTFGLGCMKIQPNDIKPITNASTNTKSSSSANLSSTSSTVKGSIYNIKELTAGFITPMKQSGQLTFTDKFIDGEFEDINYLGRKIKISNCNDLLTYDLREISNIVSSDRNILLIRKRACILIKDITNNSYNLASNSNYENSEFIPILDEHLEKIVASIPPRISENRNVNCSTDQYNNVACLDKREPEKYSLYINQVAIHNNKNYYYVTVNAALPIYYYLTTINGNKVDTQWIYY